MIEVAEFAWSEVEVLYSIRRDEAIILHNGALKPLLIVQEASEHGLDAGMSDGDMIQWVRNNYAEEILDIIITVGG